MIELLAIEQVLSLTGISRSTLGHHRSSPNAKTPFPQPMIVAGQSPLWNKADVDKWITTRDTRSGAASKTS